MVDKAKVRQMNESIKREERLLAVFKRQRQRRIVMRMVPEAPTPPGGVAAPAGVEEKDAADERAKAPSVQGVDAAVVEAPVAGAMEAIAPEVAAKTGHYGERCPSCACRGYLQKRGREHIVVEVPATAEVAALTEEILELRRALAAAGEKQEAQMVPGREYLGVRGGGQEKTCGALGPQALTVPSTTARRCVCAEGREATLIGVDTIRSPSRSSRLGRRRCVRRPGGR